MSNSKVKASASPVYKDILSSYYLELEEYLSFEEHQWPTHKELEELLNKCMLLESPTRERMFVTETVHKHTSNILC